MLRVQEHLGSVERMKHPVERDHERRPNDEAALVREEECGAPERGGEDQQHEQAMRQVSPGGGCPRAW